MNKHGDGAEDGLSAFMKLAGATGVPLKVITGFLRFALHPYKDDASTCDVAPIGPTSQGLFCVEKLLGGEGLFRCSSAQSPYV